MVSMTLKGESLKFKAFVTTDPEKFESNQWQMGANDKEYGEQNQLLILIKLNKQLEQQISLLLV